MSSSELPGASEQPRPTAPAEPTPTANTSEATPIERFREHVEAKRAGSDDFELEDQLWTGGYSPKDMIGVWILLALVSIGIIVAAFLVPQLTPAIAAGVILLLWLITGSVYAWRRLGMHYELTTQRFIHKAGIITRRTDRIEVIDIDDVSYTQGPVQRLFGVGCIRVTSSDRSHPDLLMRGIANVTEIAGLIDDIRRKERRRRSLHIESI